MMKKILLGFLFMWFSNRVNPTNHERLLAEWMSELCHLNDDGDDYLPLSS